MANNYEIKLGINFDNKELKNIKTQLNGLTDNTHRIRIDIDNSRLLKQIEHAKRELKELNSTKGNQPSLTVNTKSLEDSLSRVADVIDEVKKSLGTLDDKSGMKSLLSSVNQIANALGRVTDESETLVKSLSALSKKDFSVNFDVKFGGSNSVSNSAAYGNIVRNEIIPELKRQEQAIGNYLAKHYKTNELSALNKLAGDSLGGMNGIIDLLDRLESPLKKGESLDGRMQEFQNFFNIIRKAADIENIKLPSFDKQYDELIKNAYDIKNGVKEAESSVEKFEDVLKRAFGSGVNVDGLAEQLEPIIADLGEIKRTLDSLSKNNSIDGLTASFNRLSDVLDKIVANFDAIKNISAGLPNMSSVNSGVADNIEKVSDDSANTVVRNEEKKQSAIQETAKTYDKISKNTSLVRDGGDFEKVFEESNQAAQEAQRHFQELLADEKAVVSVTEQFDNMNSLQSFVVNIQRASGEVESLRYSIRNLAEEGEEDDFRFIYQGASSSDVKVKKQLEARIKKANDLRTKLDKIKSDYSDMGAAKPIKDSDHINALDKQYRKVEKAIEDIRNADNTMSSSVISNAEKQRAVLESMVKEYRNAETVATSLRSKDINTVGATYDSDLDVLISKMRKDGVYTSGFEKGAENLRSILSDAVVNRDKSGLVDFLNGLDKLEAGYKRASAAKKEFNRSESVGIDSSKLNQRIENLRRISPEIDKFEAEINGARVTVKSLLSDLDNIKVQGDFTVVNKKFKAFEAAAEAAGITVKETVTNTKSDFKRLISITREMGNIKVKIAGLDADENAGEIERLKIKLSELGDEYNELFAATSKNLSSGQLDELTQEAVEASNKLDMVNAKIDDMKAKLANAEIRDIKLKITTGDFDEDISKIDGRLNNLSGASEKLTASVEETKAAFAEMKRLIGNNDDEVVDVEKLREARDKYNQALEKTNNLLRMQERAEKADNDRLKLEDDRKLFQSNIDTWLKKNSAAAGRFGEAMQKLRADAESCDRIKLNRLSKQFKLLDNLADKAGLKIESLGDRIKGKFKEYSAYFSVAEVFMEVTQALKNMFDQVLVIDTAMTELKKVTDETDASYNRFLSNASTRAKAIGTTIDGLVTSTADFARLGYEFKDAQKLAEVANIYAVVGDDIDSVETATESLISTMTAFGVEASNSMSIVDKFNIIGNNFAISSGGIGEALERSASSMAAANNSLDETIALITAANTVVQDADSVGTAFKTISMRIRGAKTDLEEAGLDAEGMASSTAKLREEILALSGVDIMLDSTTFKSTYKIMEELSAKWQDLTDIQQASVTELIAGKRQGNIVSSLMTNFDIAQNALQTSLKSSGSAMEEHEKYMDSLEAKMSQLKAAWQGFSQTFLDSSFLKGGVDILKTLVELLDKLVDNFGVLGTAGLGVIGTGIFQYFKFIKNDGAKTIETIKNVTDAINNITNSATNVTEITSDIVDSTGKAMSTVTNVSNASKTASNIVDSTGKTITKVADAALDGADAMTDLGNAVTKTTGGFKAFMKTPAGIASAIGLVVAAIGLAYNAYKKAKEAAAEARQEAIAASDEFLDAADSFEQAYIKYSDKTDLTAEEEAELEAAIKGTVDALGDKSSALQGVVNSSNDYLASLERISKEELKAADVAARAKKIAAEKELEETANSSSGFLGILGKKSTVDIASGVNPNSEEVAKIAKEIGEKYYKTLSSSNSGVTAKVGFELSSDASAEEIVDYYNMLLEYQEKLSDPEIGLENSSAYDNVTKAINAMSDAIDVYTGGVYDAVKAQYQLSNGIPKTIEEYVKMREAILNSEDIKGASFDSKKIIANSLDSEYGKLFDISAAEVQARKFVGIISGYGDGTKDDTNEIGTVETFLNVRTAVNNNECTVGKYLSELNNVTSMAENFSDEEKKEFNLAFGLDVDPIKEQYDNIYNYISRNYLDKLDTADMPVSAAQEYIDYETKRVQEILGNLSAIELKALANIKTEIDWENINVDKILAQIKEEAELQEALTFKLNISAEAEGIDALNTAMKESVDAAGLSSESFAILKSRYAELDDYDPSKLFERTSQGIHLNREELNKLEKQLTDSKIKEVDKDLDALTKAYADVTEEIRDCSDETKRNELVAEQLKYANRIKELSEMRSQYEGLTSAYNNWVNAQESGEEGDIYDDVIEKLESAAELRKKGLVGTNEFAAAVGFMSGKDTSSMTVDEIVKAYDEATPKMKRYFTDSSKGAQNLLNDLNGINKEWAYINENGEWKLDIPLEEAAKELGISVDALEAVLGKGTDYGLTIDYDSIYEASDSLETLYTKAESANNKLKELGHTDFTFSFESTDAKDLEMQIEKAQEIVDTIKEADEADDGKINLSVEGAEESKRVLETLMRQKQEVTKPAFMEVSYSVLGDADLGNAIRLLQSLQSYKNTYDVQVAINADTSETETKIQEVIGEINTLKTENPQVFADLNLNTKEFNTALNTLSGNINAKAQLDPDSLETVQTALSGINAKVLADVGIGNTDALNALEGQADIVPIPTTKDVGDDFTGSAVIKVAPNTFDLGEAFYGSGQIGITPYLTTKKLTVEVESKEVSEVNGTANANGTAFINGSTGKAFKQGSWGIKDSGTALVGELGMETLVRNGRFYTIGDTGAEFIQYRKGDIIFNHEQTKELFEHGKVTSGGGRGKMFANGTAFAEGTAFNDGNVVGGGTLYYLQSLEENAKKAAKKAKEAEKAAADAKAAIPANNVEGGGKVGAYETTESSSSSSSSSSTKTKDDFKETIDWIEIAISRIEREIDNLDKKANNVYKSWGSRNKALTSEISKVGDEIQLQSSAYDEYMSEANNVGLSKSWQNKVKNGKVDIETIKDEALAEKIKNYQNWYEKALQCKDAIEDLKETESALYAQRFENIQTQYDGILQGYEHTETMLNEYISQAEEQGHIVSKRYYNSLISNEKSNIAQLKKEQAALIKARDEAVADKKIPKYSQEWYDMCAEIDSVTQSIEEGETSLLSYARAMEEIDWSIFDLIQERISGVTEESDFLIELMSNKKLYEDNGALTSQGFATMGLHAQNYDTHMYQADAYGDEIAKLNKQISSDPYDQELINRRNELLGLQRESILAAEDEKNAIRDMVEEGINLELDALQELIDKKNEELESEKDLYEYQKKVKEQTEEIASIEKQLAAYSGDNSEESRAKIQELKVSLEDAKENLKETEYDKYIGDQQSMLDSLYTEYELILNQRLDNIDALLQSVIDSINNSEGAIPIAVSENATSIKETLTTEAKAVGTTLSSEMKNIWSTGEGNAKSVLTMYGDDFKSKSATIITTLNGIKTSVNAMVSKLNEEAAKKVAANKTSTSAKKDPTKTSTSTTKATPKKSTSGGDGKAKVGDKVKFVSGQYYYDSQGKKPLGSKYQGKQVYITSINTEKWATHPYHISTGNKIGKGDLGWLKLNQLSGYLTGKKRISKDEFAWTQERGMEYIIRPSDGAILTPLAKRDSVLNATASSNIWNMANSPAEFIRDNLKLDASSVPNASNVNSSVIQNFENITFSMPNVRGYNDLLTEMQRDPKFEKLVLSMTIDRIAGRSSLAKGKSIR